MSNYEKRCDGTTEYPTTKFYNYLGRLPSWMCHDDLCTVIRTFTNFPDCSVVSLF